MAGYYQTPNVNIPHNKRDKGKIADLAIAQLMTYQLAAITWPMYTDNARLDADDFPREVKVCEVCDQALWFISDTVGRVYSYSADELSSLIVAHIRQAHPEAASNE